MHKEKIIMKMLISLIMIASLSIIFSFTDIAVASKDIYVDNASYPYRDGSAEHPYETIQYAIDVANEGDTIYVFGGEYNETLVVDKNITLVGSIEGGDTIIAKNAVNKYKYMVKITADFVTFEGFNVTDRYNKNLVSLLYVSSDNVVIQGNNLTNSNTWSIYLDSSDDNTIGNNRIEQTKGIILDTAKNNVISNNVFANCTDASVYVRSSSDENIIYGNFFNQSKYGIHSVSSSNLNISSNSFNKNSFDAIKLHLGSSLLINNNTITNNGGTGININSDFSTIKYNTVEDNQFGIALSSDGCTFFNNTIKNTIHTGLDCEIGTQNNIFYQNRFKINDNNAVDQGTNQWYHNQHGNYWDDYNQPDKNLDGIGDVPYKKNGIDDRYPLGYFLKPPEKPTNPTPEDNAENVNLKITLEVEVNDEDSAELDVYFYNANTSELLGVDKNVQSGETGTYTINRPFQTTYAWYTVADDGIYQNQSDIWFFITRQRPPENEKPNAVPGGPYEGNKNEPLIFNGSGSNDPDGTIDFYRWNFGDGTSEILMVDPTHTYTKSGTYTVTLTVIDNDGTSNIATTTVNISSEPSNKKPKPIITAVSEAKQNTQILFSAQNSTDSDGTIVNYTWSFGDETIAYGIEVTHEYKKASTYLVSLTVTDDDDTSQATSTTITITKVKEDTPGFELILLLVAGCFLMMRSKRKNKKS